MASNHFLFGPDGQQLLQREYVENGRSTTALSKELGVYPNLIVRALHHHNITIRTKGEAQALALESGRRVHPTKGKPLSSETKSKIGDKVSQAYSNMTDEEKQKRAALTSEQWEKRSDKEKQGILSKANKNVRRTAKDGSKLEQYLSAGLKLAGFDVNFHSEYVVQNEKMHVDLTVHLKDAKVAIEVDGPTHYLPIFGEEQLAKARKADAEKNGLLLSSGFKVIRIKDVNKNLSEVKMRRTLSTLQEKLADTALEDYTEIEVK
jgi:very-short-patch-repair endonuclease